MNQPPRGVQDMLHSLESGSGRRWMGWLLALLLGVAVLSLYLFTEARNFSNLEAMEMAQVGRSLASGQGYTTHFIRPVGLQYLQQRAVDRGLPAAGLLKRAHPDLQNPPVYPAMIAVLFKALPVRWRAATADDVLRDRIPAEMAITVLNLGWFALGVWLVFRLGARLFDRGVGGMAAAAYAGTEMFWRFSSNGLPTTFLVVLVCLLLELLTRLDESGTELAPGVVPPLGRPLRLAALLGLLLGIGFLTQYAFGWLAIPAVVWLLVTHVRRWSTSAVCLLVFALVASPWLARNHHLSGHLLGTAGTALVEGTATFPESTVQRFLHAQKQQPDVTEMRVKLAVNLAEVFRTSVPRIAGSWMTCLFIAGLVLPFRSPVLRRLRWFTVGALALLAVVEALFRTQGARLVPDVNPENHLVLLVPAIFLLGAALFFSLIDNTEFGHPLFRSLFVGGAWVVVSLPLLSCLLPPRTYPLVEPTYRPDIIREITGYTQPGELLMSDIPWAVGWYGDRDCIWLPLALQDTRGEDFYAVNDFERPVAMLYISPYTSEEPLRRTGMPEFVWGRFYLDALIRRNLPTGFPLRYGYPGSAKNGHLLLADRPRWE